MIIKGFGVGQRAMTLGLGYSEELIKKLNIIASLRKIEVKAEVKEYG